MKDDSSGRLITTPFEKLLEWLNPDHELAAKEYERLRKRLIDYFEHYHIPGEEYADKTFDRIADMLEKGKIIYTGTQVRYCLTVAHYLRLEYWHSPESRWDDYESSVINSDNAVAEWLCEQREQALTDLEIACMKTCLAQLEPDQRRLLLLYCGGDEQTRPRNRQKLAKEMGINEGALRKRVHDARHVVRKCYQDCLKRHGIER